MRIKCNRCCRALRSPGALAFSPMDDKSKCVKYHICRVCWPEFWELLNTCPPGNHGDITKARFEGAP